MERLTEHGAQGMEHFSACSLQRAGSQKLEYRGQKTEDSYGFNYSRSISSLASSGMRVG
jgi:hypothetical protein